MKSTTKIMVSNKFRASVMKSVVLVLAMSVAATAATHSGAALYESSPDELLLYLYDVVLTSHMMDPLNDQGCNGVLNFECMKCPANHFRIADSSCVPILEYEDYNENNGVE
ncbi:unnamed protein product [Chrysodeixis includens]|uniref:Uncharacterized protein n=1 Tax=Chrysodeixis includens TaxID=689277 RepID=A0A9P0BXD6_CHRIL|nr:unnamed protein product [Chrysodeixis includens]